MAILNMDLGATEVELDRAVKQVDEGLTQALPDPEQRDLFLLAFVEALNNAAEHGSQWNPLPCLHVRGQFRPGLALLSVADEGPGHQPRIPDLPKVVGKRGRGLGFVKEFSDQVIFNQKGNQIVFWKGCAPMFPQLKHGVATFARLPEGVVVVTEFVPKENVFSAMGELLDVVSQIQWKRLFINLGQVKLLTSTAWGSIFAEAGREGTELLVLFNAPASVVTSAQAMGVERQQGIQGRILVAPDFEKPFMLLCQSLEQHGQS